MDYNDVTYNKIQLWMQLLEILNYRSSRSMPSSSFEVAADSLTFFLPTASLQDVLRRRNKGATECLSRRDCCQPWLCHSLIRHSAAACEWTRFQGSKCLCPANVFISRSAPALISVNLTSGLCLWIFIYLSVCICRLYLNYKIIFSFIIKSLI